MKSHSRSSRQLQLLRRVRQGQAAFEFVYVQAIVSEGVGQTGDDLFAFRDEARGRKSSARRVGHENWAIIALIAGGRDDVVSTSGRHLHQSPRKAFEPAANPSLVSIVDREGSLPSLRC